MSVVESLRSQYPLIALLLEILITGLVAAAIWFVFSILFALLYAATSDSLRRAAVYLQGLTLRLASFAQSVWLHAASSIDIFIDQLSLKWIFVEQDALVGIRMNLVRRTVDDIGQRIEGDLSEMRSSMDSFRGAVEALTVPSSDIAIASAQGSSDEVREAARSRRTALVVLVVISPLLLAIVVLNTTMLMKFFESFIDEWLSFRWGIKISTVLGLFFSGAEVGLGILLYYAGREKNTSGVLAAAKQLLWITMIVFLALIETYLYYRLSFEMTADRAHVPDDGLPTVLHTSWLALFGPVLTILLSGLGHVWISAVNQFVDAGLQKNQQKILEEMRQTWTSVMKSGSELQRRISEVKNRCVEFIKELRDGNEPTSALAVVEEARNRLSAALETGRKIRLNPYASADAGDTRRTFSLFTLMAVALLVIIVLFCWIQFLYAGTAIVFALHPFILIAGAVVQAAAVLIASYKIHSPVVFIVEGQPAEVLHGSREMWTRAFAGLAIVAVVLLNVALAGGFSPEPFQWIAFLLAMVCIAAFGLIGRTLPIVSATLKLWILVLGTASIAVAVWAGSLLCWIGRFVFVVVKALLYVLAYPFFLVFWKKKLEPAE